LYNTITCFGFLRIIKVCGFSNQYFLQYNQNIFGYQLHIQAIYNYIGRP
jgi:hypothetical protein